MIQEQTFLSMLFAVLSALVLVLLVKAVKWLFRPKRRKTNY